MKHNTEMPSTQNEAWGFWGTMGEQASMAWPLAMSAISNATGEPLTAVQSFLDSAQGRHFADEVLNGLHAGQDLGDAVDTTTERWMAWTIGRQTSQRCGIPRGMPYLKGFVIHSEIAAEAAVQTAA